MQALPTRQWLTLPGDSQPGQNVCFISQSWIAERQQASRVPLPHVQASRHSAELRASAALFFSVVLASWEHITLLTVVPPSLHPEASAKRGRSLSGNNWKHMSAKKGRSCLQRCHVVSSKVDCEDSLNHVCVLFIDVFIFFIFA